MGCVGACCGALGCGELRDEAGAGVCAGTVGAGVDVDAVGCGGRGSCKVLVVFVCVRER